MFLLTFGVMLIPVLLLVAYLTGRWTGTVAASMLGLVFGILIAFCIYKVSELKRASDEFQRFHPKGTNISSVAASNYTSKFIEKIVVNQLVESSEKDVSIFSLGGYSIFWQGSCCLNLPSRWYAGMTLRVEWDATYFSLPWKQIYMLPEKEREKYMTKRHLQREIPVPEYKEVAQTHLYFLPEDQLDVWVTPDAWGQKSPSGRDKPINPDPVD